MVVSFNLIIGGSVPLGFFQSPGIDDFLPSNPNRVAFCQNVIVNGRTYEHFSKVFVIHSLPGSRSEIPCFTIFSECFIKISADLCWDTEFLSFRELYALFAHSRITGILTFVEEALFCSKVYICVAKSSSPSPASDTLLRSLFRLGFEAQPPSVCMVDDCRVFSLEL